MVDRTNPFAFKMVAPSMGDAAGGNQAKKQKRMPVDKRKELAETLLEKDGPKTDLFMIFLQMYALGDFKDVDENEIVAFLAKLFKKEDPQKVDIKKIFPALKKSLLIRFTEEEKEQIESKFKLSFSNKKMYSSMDNPDYYKSFKIQVINQIKGSEDTVLIDEPQLHANKRMAEGSGNQKFVNEIYNHFAENFIFILSIYNNIDILLSEKERFMLMLGLQDWRSRSAELEESPSSEGGQFVTGSGQYTKNYVDFAIFKAVESYLMYQESDSDSFGLLHNEFISPVLENNFIRMRFDEGKKRVNRNRRHTDSYFNLSFTSDLADITARSATGRDLPVLPDGGGAADPAVVKDEGGPAEDRPESHPGSGTEQNPIVL